MSAFADRLEASPDVDVEAESVYLLWGLDSLCPLSFSLVEILAPGWEFSADVLQVAAAVLGKHESSPGEARTVGLALNVIGKYWPGVARPNWADIVRGLLDGVREVPLFAECFIGIFPQSGASPAEVMATCRRLAALHTARMA